MQPKCCICGAPVEPWPMGGGYGHNPDPFGSPPSTMPDEMEDRCCNWCNDNLVIPARIQIHYRIASLRKDSEGGE